MRTAFRILAKGRWFVQTNILSGGKLFVNVFDPGIGWQLLTRGIREEAHVEQISSALKPGMRGIEIGANIGFFALVEAPLVGPSGHIWCIEPVPDNLLLLHKNIKANGFESRITVMQQLIGDSIGVRHFELASASNSHVVCQNASENSIAMPMTTLDDFMEKTGIPADTIDFIRMDLEGYEVCAATGMEKLFRQSQKLKMFLELHPDGYSAWGWTFEGFLRYLASFGFRVKEVAKENETSANGTVRTVIEEYPSIERLLALQKNWKPGGIQACFEKV